MRSKRAECLQMKVGIALKTVAECTKKILNVLKISSVNQLLLKELETCGKNVD